jgi:2-beta-glucuronyltransferase
MVFHVIGSESDLQSRGNLLVYPEMAFAKTLPYLAHATIGLAPYLETPSAAYISESSLKLLQYNYLRRPAVCPDFAVGGHRNRFGYRPGDPPSIKAAIERACAHAFEPVEEPLSWDDVVARMLEPKRFAGAALREDEFAAGGGA